MPRSAARKPKADVASGALPSEALEHSFPKLHLPVQPPYPPAEARSVTEIPPAAGWLYEPKWDGFRCLAFRDGASVAMHPRGQSSFGMELSAASGFGCSAFASIT